MNAHRTPRPIDAVDLAAPVSLARQFLADRDVPSNQGDARVCAILRQLLRYHFEIAEQAAVPTVAYDRQLVAAMLREPGRYRSDVVAMQAALVAGDVGPDTPMSEPPRRARQLPDDGA